MNENENKLAEQNVELKEVKKQKPSKTGVVPTTELELGKVAVNVCKKWKTSPWLTLLWKKEADFTKEVGNYNKVLSARVKQGASRPQITTELEQLNNKIEDSLIYVKGYILDKHKKEKAKSHYASFGFVRKKDSFVFPGDQSSRLEALKLMVEAIKENGFEDKEFGLVFWSKLHDEYEAAVELASETDGSVSLKVGDKNVLKKEVKKVLNALVGVIKSNYPDTYKEELRSWGFQKEKY